MNAPGATPGAAPVFDIVVAADDALGIARGGDLPWHLPGDLKHFRELTTAAAPGAAPPAVIMGRVTWESIPARFRPLPRRYNVVVTRAPDYRLPEGVGRAGGLDAALAVARDRGAQRVFVLGGGEIYRQAIHHPAAQSLYITRVRGDFGCDTFFPPFEDAFRLDTVLAEAAEDGVAYRIERWVPDRAA